MTYICQGYGPESDFPKPVRATGSGNRQSLNSEVCLHTPDHAVLEVIRQCPDENHHGCDRDFSQRDRHRDVQVGVAEGRTRRIEAPISVVVFDPTGRLDGDVRPGRNRYRNFNRPS